MKIIGISGRKQSGKNTIANILHGIVLKNQGLIKDFNIDNHGKLYILTNDTHGQEGWGEFDVTRHDPAFIQYSELNMWPFIKLYSFADHLKWICVKLFDIPEECVFGTDEQKNQTQDHLRWELMPGHVTTHHGYGSMTAREFMQFFGTDIMRNIHESVWVNSCLRTINKEQSQVAIIADLRFPNEADKVKAAGGVLMRATRNSLDDSHSSETALDDYDFDHYIDNQGSIDSLVTQVKSLHKKVLET